MATAKERREEKARLATAEAAAKAIAAGKPTSEQIEALNKETILHPDRVPDAHGEILQPASAGGKVFVGCKIGLAYIDLQLSQLVKVTEQTQTGAREVMQPRRYGAVVRIRGTAYPRGTVPDGFPDKPEMFHGCAVNPDVDREFMIEYMKLNSRAPYVVNKMIFFAENRESLRAMAEELEGTISGFEPLNPKKDPRAPRSTNADVGQIETEEARAQKMKSLHA